MVSLVNDILDMSRIEAGKIELEDKPFDIRVLADKLRNMFQESVEAKNLRFDDTRSRYRSWYGHHRSDRETHGR